MYPSAPSNSRRNPMYRSICFLALFLASTSDPTPTAAQSVYENLWATDGPVNAVAVANGQVYLGGAFERVGPPTGGYAGVDISTGATLSPYFQVVGTVFAQAPDGNGGWFIGGDFTAVRGQKRKCLAHIDAAGNVLPWNPNYPVVTPNPVIHALRLHDNTLYVGGGF